MREERRGAIAEETTDRESNKKKEKWRVWIKRDL